MAGAPRLEAPILSWVAQGALGCSFAPTFKNQKIFATTVSLDGEAIGELGGIIRASAKRSMLAAIVFPEADGERDIAQVIRLLAASGEWVVRRTETKYPDRVAVELLWKTESGKLTSAMGVAPTFNMPFTRRCQVVGMVLWPSAHENRHMLERDELGLGSARTDMSAESYRAAFDQTKAMTRELLARDLDSVQTLRQTTFRISAELAPELPIG